MEIQLKLMGMLKAKTPPGGTLEAAEGATIDSVLEQLGIPAKAVHLVMVNNRQERDRSRQLSAGDELMVMPPVGGGQQR